MKVCRPLVINFPRCDVGVGLTSDDFDSKYIVLVRDDLHTSLGWIYTAEKRCHLSSKLKYHRTERKTGTYTYYFYRSKACIC